MHADLIQLAKRGVHFHGAQDFQMEGIAHDWNLAMDAQPALTGTNSAGIPAFLSMYIDPKSIPVLFSPMQAVEIVGAETKKGDWTTTSAMFQMIESTGFVSNYDDFGNSGRAGANVTFPQRQNQTFQVMTKYGEMEMERAGLARVDWANALNIASILTLNKYQNLTYFFGCAGVTNNYGLLNDPNLPASIVAGTKAAGGTTWTAGTALEIFLDVQNMYKQAQTQMLGNVTLKSKMTLAMSPLSEVNLTKVVPTYGTMSVADLIKKTFPNMEIKTAVEYNTAGSGLIAQLICESDDGQATAECAFTEKLRTHAIVVGNSSWSQKKSQGTYGTVIYRPMNIVGMTGL